jgi:2-methylcitrate dehydratase PrpD
MRIAQRVTVEEGAEFNAAYPGKQGASVEVTLTDGSTRLRSLADVVPATPEGVRARFEQAATKMLGSDRAWALQDTVAKLETLSDVGVIATMTQG